MSYDQSGESEAKDDNQSSSDNDFIEHLKSECTCKNPHKQTPNTRHKRPKKESDSERRNLSSETSKKRKKKKTKTKKLD